MLVTQTLYPRYSHGVSAKWLKSLTLHTVLGVLKVFTGEMNIIIVALVFSVNELHTQGAIIETLEGCWGSKTRGVWGQLETITVQPWESTQAGLPELGAHGRPWPHLVGGCDFGGVK